MNSESRGGTSSGDVRDDQIIASAGVEDDDRSNLVPNVLYILKLKLEKEMLFVLFPIIIRSCLSGR